MRYIVQLQRVDVWYVIDTLAKRVVSKRYAKASADAEVAQLNCLDTPPLDEENAV